ncbi:KTSC domain-containing protein [Geitlerinema splendidum]|nr:KTSC domain-containing protein [Geitlerinema splendidum]
MKLTKLDLSNIMAIGHENDQLTLLIDRGETIEYLEIPAPVYAYQGLQFIDAIATDNIIEAAAEVERLEESEPEDADIPMLPVRSGMASAIGYDLDRQTLQVAFRNGSVYQYSDVDIDTWEDFRKSASVGKVYNAKIKGIFPSRRVEH